LIIWKVLIGLKQWEFIEPVVNFDPPGHETCWLVCRLSEGTRGYAYMFSVFRVGFPYGKCVL
jgi:hypothetical protein